MPKARLHFDGDNTGIEKEARVYSLTQDVENKLDSISTIETTLQGEIDDLQNQINQVASRGRYLSTWDCTTGLPDTNPTTDPYAYRAGDYYIVGTVGGTNYRPNGSEYHAGVQSQVIESQTVSVNDLYIYDGTRWTLQRTGASVFAVRGSITGNLQAQTDLQNALNDKANRTDVLEKTNTTSYTPTADYHPSTKKYSDDNDTYIGTSAPTNNVVEGRLWYDTAADVLKVYNGSQWVPTGKTYTAGQNIQISASDVISATDTVYSAGENVNIVCPTESDMKGPCPSGFHVPLQSEWGAVRDIGVTLGAWLSNDGTGMITYIKLPFSGDMSYSDARIEYVGNWGIYWCSDCYTANNNPYCLFPRSVEIRLSTYQDCYGGSVRPFKNTPVAPDSSWTMLYDGSSVATGAGIFWNATDGLISLSDDGTNWYTMADKNVGAVNVGDVGKYYQRGNNYGFSANPTTSSTKVDSSSYGPGNYYSNSTFITSSVSAGLSWQVQKNVNLWGGVTQGTWQDCEHPIISSTDTTYQASDFDIKDLTDSTGLRTKWDNKQDKVSAGRNINISGTTINARDTEYEAGENVNIVCPTESDMKGPAPDGFHVPLTTEWKAVRDIRVALGGGSSDGPNFGIALKLPFAGYRDYSSAGAGRQGSHGYYWSSSCKDASSAYYLYFYSTTINPQNPSSRALGQSVRCFKNSPTVPTSSWTKLYGTSIEAGGIFWNSTDGLISLSSDGQTWITIADKNVGATAVWNIGDTLSEANCGKYYQRGNNYGFAWTGTVTTSSTQVDASTYGPGNYYSSSTFITRSSSPYRWDSTDNGNLWGGATQGTWQDCEHPIISATDTIYSAGDNISITNNTISADVNTKTFYLADNQDTTTAQAALNRVLAGKNAILVFDKRTYLLYKHYSGQNCIFITCPTINDTPARWGGGYSATNTETLWLNYSGTTITSISNPSSDFGPKVLETDYNYGNPYTPLYDGSPATKKYVDDIASTKQNNMSAGEGIEIKNGDYSDMQGPCSAGYHVPLNSEWIALLGILYTTFGLSRGVELIGTYLKIPAAGLRDCVTSYAVGTAYAQYWSSSSSDSEKSYALIGIDTVASMAPESSANGYSIRPFKNVPVVPDGSNDWTTLYDGSSIATGAGIFYNATEGIISISGDGTTWITMADKNLGATTVYNRGDTKDNANCGGFFQWGNNYMFPGAYSSDSMTTDNIQVDTTGYGPENYYSDNTFIISSSQSIGWLSVDNPNLRGGVSQRSAVYNNAITVSKQYVNEHGAVIPVYYYHGTFSSDITCALNEAGTFRVTINGYHSGNLNRTITINADGTDVASYQSNVIEVFSFMSVVSANTSLKISIDSTTAFTIHDVYIEKINVQSGYLTATVN